MKYLRDLNGGRIKECPWFVPGTGITPEQSWENNLYYIKEWGADHSGWEWQKIESVNPSRNR